MGVVVAAGHCGRAHAHPLSLAAFGKLALQCGPSVAPSTLAALARTESDLQPLSLNDNTTGTSGVPATRDEAMRIATPLLAAGHSVDIGLMQINSRNFGSLGLTLDAALDPCRSIAAAAAILVGDYAGGATHDAQQSALRVAFSRYNTGDARRGFANGYVHKVELAAQLVVPALDVGDPVATTEAQHAPAAAVAAPVGGAIPVASATAVDPDAPPPWDVWRSYDYAVAHRQRADAADTRSAPKLAVLVDAGRGPPATATIPGPTAERLP